MYSPVLAIFPKKRYIKKNKPTKKRGVIETIKEWSSIRMPVLECERGGEQGIKRGEKGFCSITKNEIIKAKQSDKKVIKK